MWTFNLLLHQATAHRRRITTGVATIIAFLPVFQTSLLVSWHCTVLLTITSCPSFLFAPTSLFCFCLYPFDANTHPSSDGSSMPALLCSSNSPLAVSHLGYLCKRRWCSGHLRPHQYHHRGSGNCSGTHFLQSRTNTHLIVNLWNLTNWLISTISNVYIYI